MPPQSNHAFGAAVDLGGIAASFDAAVQRIKAIGNAAGEAVGAIVDYASVLKGGDWEPEDESYPPDLTDSERWIRGTLSPTHPEHAHMDPTQVAIDMGVLTWSNPEPITVQTIEAAIKDMKESKPRGPQPIIVSQATYDQMKKALA